MSPMLGKGHFDRRWLPPLAILFLALLLTLPATLSPIKLHDSFWIDWAWTDQFAEQLRRGVLYPRWLPASNDGLGSPVFYYYPPLAFYPAGLLAAAGLSTYGAIIAAFGLAFAGAGTTMYLWARGWTNHPLAAALLFMAAPYHLLDFYGRGALAECFAIAWIPLLALGLRRAVQDRAPALAALAYGVMIATHLPLALLASLFLVAPYSLALAKDRPRALLTLATALALGIGMSAIYLLPALALAPYRDAGVLWSVEQLRTSHWLLTTHIGSEPLDGMRLITLKIVAVLGLPALFMALRWRSGWAAYAVIVCAVVAGLLPFFWNLPLVRSVQFPFRALPLAEFGLATAIAMAPKGRLAALLVMPAILLSTTFLLAPAPEGALVTFEELASRHPDVPENLPPGPRPYRWPSTWALDLATGHRGPIQRADMTIEPTFYFPAWRVTCAGRPEASYRDPQTGLLTHRGAGCMMTLGRTSPEIIGAWISAAALALLLLLCWRRRRPTGRIGIGAIDR